VLIGGMALLATARLGSSTTAKFEVFDSKSDKSNNGGESMGNITTKDGLRFSTKTGEKDSLSFFHTAGR